MDNSPPLPEFCLQVLWDSVSCEFVSCNLFHTSPSTSIPHKASTEVCITIGILHFNEEGIIIHKMVVVGYDVGMVEEGENVNLILCIFADFLTEHAQVHLFPYHQAVVL